MNFILSSSALESQKVRFDRQGIISEATECGVRLHRIGLQPERHVVFRQEDGTERSIGLAADRIVDVSGSAAWPGLAQVVKLMRADEAVDAWRVALFEQCGELFVETAPVDDRDGAIVCACKGSTRGEICALKARGLDRVGIGQACGAGTVCGGCGPLIEEITGQGSLLAGELVEVERRGRDMARFRFR